MTERSNSKTTKVFKKPLQALSLVAIVLILISAGFFFIKSSTTSPILYNKSERDKIALAVALPSLGQQVKFKETPNFSRNAMASSDIADAQITPQSGISAGWGKVWGSSSLVEKSVPQFSATSKSTELSVSIVARKVSGNHYIVRSYSSYGADEHTGKRVVQVSAPAEVTFKGKTITFYSDSGKSILLKNGQQTKRLHYVVKSKGLFKNSLVSLIASRLKFQSK